MFVHPVGLWGKSLVFPVVCNVVMYTEDIILTMMYRII